MMVSAVFRSPGTGVFCIAAICVVMIASNHGGYAPPAWGWACLVFGWLGVAALVIRRDIDVSAVGVVLLAAGAGFVAWIALSIIWSADRPQSVMELQRSLVYLLGGVALAFSVRTPRAPALLGGLLTGIVLVCAIGLATRLFPDSATGVEALGQNRLAAPLGYWNALGIVAAMGALLAVGLAARAARRVSRVLAAMTLPLLVTTLYFTYSRGAWGALVAGVIVVLLADRRRLQYAGTLPFIALGPAATVWIASRLTGLTSSNAPGDIATRDGRTLAVLVVASSLMSGALSLLSERLQPRLAGRERTRRASAVFAAAGAAALIMVAAFNSGDLAASAEKAHASFVGEQPRPQSSASRSDLNNRLFTLRSNGRLEMWQVSFDQHDRHPWLGEGAGTFEQAWLRQRTIPGQVRDAHGIYAETLGELGWIGLALLVLMFAVPAVAALRCRDDLAVPAAFGPYAAFLVHAGLDWDWEMPAVTLLAVACGVLLVGAAGGRTWRLQTPARAGAVAALSVVTAFAALGLVGNRALGRASEDVAAGRWEAGLEHARTATQWSPWSAEALQYLGNAQLGLGRRRLAERALSGASAKAPEDWQIWFDLGTASRGEARRRAYDRVAQLNPLAKDIEGLRDQGYALPGPQPGES